MATNLGTLKQYSTTKTKMREKVQRQEEIQYLAKNEGMGPASDIK